MSACSLITSSIALNNAGPNWGLMNTLQRINWTYNVTGVPLWNQGKTGTQIQFQQSKIR